MRPRHLNPTSAAVRVLAAAAVLAAVGGLVWYGTAQAGAAAPAPGPMPGPQPEPESAGPWDEFDAMVDKGYEEYGEPEPDTYWLEAEGDGETTSGVPYVWRVYGNRGTMTDPEGREPPHEFELYSAIVLFQESDGTWSTWGDTTADFYMTSAGSPESAAEQIGTWAAEH